MIKKENICEIMILALSIKEIILQTSLGSEPYITIEEIFENSFNQYNYSLYTYTIDSVDYTNRAISTIEYHVNNSFAKKEQSIDSNSFYNNVKYMTKLDEFIILSERFIKYISNTIINSDIGKASIVEFSRCDGNMEDIINIFGYKFKRRKDKIGFLIKYKNQPIFAYISEYRPSQNDKRHFVLEVRGLCLETEKDKLCKTLNEIKNKLSYMFIFDQ